MNITLIGMPGSGKTTIGKALAKDMGLTALDSDREIERLHGGTLAEIIARVGQTEFRHIEEEVNAHLQLDNSVLSPGGSVIYGREAMQHLKKIGVVIYLKLSCESIAARLGDLRKRGITLREGQTLQQLYDERVPLYERYADITVDCENKSIREIVAEIAARLPK